MHSAQLKLQVYRTICTCNALLWQLTHRHWPPQLSQLASLGRQQCVKPAAVCQACSSVSSLHQCVKPAPVCQACTSVSSLHQCVKPAAAPKLHPCVQVVDAPLSAQGGRQQLRAGRRQHGVRRLPRQHQPGCAGQRQQLPAGGRASAQVWLGGGFMPHARGGHVPDRGQQLPLPGSAQPATAARCT
jgi:hypothetical protein